MLISLKLKKKSENYVLKGYFNILNESIIPGNMLKVSFKPLLFSNGRETSLEQIKKGIITVNMEKEESKELIPVTNIFENIEFKDEEINVTKNKCDMRGHTGFLLFGIYKNKEA